MTDEEEGANSLGGFKSTAKRAVSNIAVICACCYFCFDEERQAIRVRPDAEKNERYRYLHLPNEILGRSWQRCDHAIPGARTGRLFPGVTDANLRIPIARACRAGGIPHFPPHALRRRRGSLHYKRTGSLAEVAELLGDSKRVAADHYVYALVDYREADRQTALERLFA